MPLESLLGAVGRDARTCAAFLESVPAAVVVFDATGQVLVQNSAAARVLGPLPARVQEVPLAPDNHETPITRALQSRAAERELTELRPPGGPARPVRLTALPLRDAQGAVAGGLLLALEAGAPPSDEAVQREVMGIVGHDLRNPLSAIRMTAQLLTKDGDMAADRRVTLAKRILTSAGRMDSIVRSLLDYARAKGGQLTRLEREPCDLTELVRRLADENEAAHSGRKIAVAVAGDASGLWDPGRLEQIVANLISNALRHGGDDGVAHVQIDGTSGDLVRLTVRNGGPPIAPEALGRIFGAFEVGPRAGGTPRRSIGLGLFIVSQFVRAHGGEVSVRSTTEEGTSFQVTLPRRPPDVTSS